MILDPFLLSDLSISTHRLVDVIMNNPNPDAFIPSIDGPLKKGFFFLIRLAWESRVRIPYLIAIAFMALDIRMQLEITVDRAVRHLPNENDIAGVLGGTDDEDEYDEDDSTQQESSSVLSDVGGLSEIEIDSHTCDEGTVTDYNEVEIDSVIYDDNTENRREHDLSPGRRNEATDVLNSLLHQSDGDTNVDVKDSKPDIINQKSSETECRYHQES